MKTRKMSVIEYLLTKATADCVQIFLSIVRRSEPTPLEALYLSELQDDKFPLEAINLKEIEDRQSVPRFFIEEKERDLWKKT